MKYILIILLVVAGFVAKSQQRFPTGVPTQFSTGFFKQGYHQSDSGTIIANRDTNWLAKYSGTVVFRPANKKFYYFDSTTLTWNQFGTVIDTTSLSNRINLKLNISDTIGQWLAQSTRLVDTIYRVNDSTIGYTIKGSPYTFQILGSASGGGGGGSGTVTSVALSMPSGFTVAGSPITTSGTFSISGAGTTAQYIRGNGTLGTFDTAAIPNFYLKVRGLLTGTSPITFNQTTGAIGINNANTSGTKGAASFTGAFSDNGSGLIDLLDLVSAGSCTGCNLNIDAKGRITGYTDGAGGATDNTNTGAGLRVLSDPSTQTLRTLFAGFGTVIDSVANANGLTWRSDTTRSTGLPSYFYVDSISGITADNGLTKTGNNVQWGGTLLQHTLIDGSALYESRFTGANPFGSGRYTVTIKNTALFGNALRVEGVDGGIGIEAVSSTGYAANVTSGSGPALQASTGANTAIIANVNPSSTNTIHQAIEIIRSTSGTPANDMGVSVDFAMETAVQARQANQIVSKFTTIDDATRTSQFEIWGVNNATAARKVAIAGSGQWTWDGYPALTAQTDSTTYKPIGIDGSGNVVKMANWAGSGGGGTDNTNFGTGFSWLNEGTQEIKRVADGYGILWDSTSTANSLTAKVDTSTLKAVYLPIHLNGSKTIDQNGFNLYFTGSGQFQSDSVKYTEMPAPPAVTDMVMLGNSIAYGQGASVPDSSLKNKLSNYYGLTLVDLSLSGSGVWRAASNFYLNVNPGHSNLTVIMAGLNDVRRNAYAPKTHNKIVNGYQGVFINQYMDTWVTATNASVTKIGSWSSGYTSSTVGGKGVSGGILSTTAGDTARWDFTGTSVAVGLMGADGVGGSSYEYANGKIYIDDVFIMNFNEDGQWDGVSDGVNDNKRGTYPLFFTGLSSGSHNIKIVQDDPGVFLVIDYFATLVEPALGKPMILVHAPYLNSAGYAASPNQANNNIIDSLNTLIDSLHAVFTAAGYPVYKSDIENCYDTLTGLSGDNIHPNDVGYEQMFQCTKLAAPSFGTPATAGTIYYADDGYFYGSKEGFPKRLAYTGDTASYILNRTSVAQTAGFKINGTGTVGTIVAPIATLGNATLASATGSLLSFSPIASQAAITMTGNITGNVIPTNINMGATTGLLWVQRNVSSAAGAYSAMALAVQGSGNGTGGAQFGFRNDGVAREYIMGYDTRDQRFKITWGNQAQFNGLRFFSLDSLTGHMRIATPPNGNTSDSLLQWRSSDSSVRKIAIVDLGVGITTLNTLTAATQTFAVGTSGTDFNINSTTSTHTFNIPDASASNRGVVTTGTQTLTGEKTFSLGVVANNAGQAAGVTISGNRSVGSAPGVGGIGLSIAAFTYTSTAGAGTESGNQNLNMINAPTLTSSNAISYTGDVATIRYAGAPIAAGSSTIDHPYNILAIDVSKFNGLALSLNEQSGDATLASASGVNVYTGAGGNTFTLPALATHPGKIIFVKNAGGGSLTVARAGADQIYDTSLVTSITLAAGSARMFMAGSAAWYVQ